MYVGHFADVNCVVVMACLEVNSWGLVGGSSQDKVVANQERRSRTAAQQAAPSHLELQVPRGFW
jgi:hypothetical protein